MPACRNSLRTILAGIVFAIVSGGISHAAPVTFDLGASGFSNGSFVTGSLTIDPDLVADPLDVSIAELDAFSDFSVTVTPGAGVGFTEFTLTDENATLTDFSVAASTITLSDTQMTFNSSALIMRIELDDDASQLFDSLLFLDFGDSILRIGNVTLGTNIDNLNLGTQSPSFTFLNTVSAVPLPAGLWFLLTGLAAFGAMAARRKSCA